MKSLCRNPGVHTLARVGADGFVTKLPPADVLTGIKILPYKEANGERFQNGPENGDDSDRCRPFFSLSGVAAESALRYPTV